jgi:hypothetical protein
MEQIKQVLKKSNVKSGVCILGSIFVALIIFQAGMFVGFKKASFSFRAGEQYFRQMNGRPNDQFMGMNRGDFPNSHGATGKIISIKLPSVIIADKDSTEKTIIISTSTDIKKFKDSVKAEDLQVNDFVTVIGNPNDKAEVEAKLIRIMPDPSQIPFNMMATGTQI